MDLTLIGYECKRTARREVFGSWLKVTNVEEVGSVSGCISEPPEGEIDWKHANNMSKYSTPEGALLQVPLAEREAYDLYLYAMLPIQFDNAREIAYEFPELKVAPPDGSFVRLGYDAVCGQEGGYPISCSPLSCNGMAKKHPVNRYCLVDTVEDAMELAREFSKEETGCEPGVYGVFEVWRRKR